MMKERFLDIYTRKMLRRWHPREACHGDTHTYTHTRAFKVLLGARSNLI